MHDRNNVPRSCTYLTRFVNALSPLRFARACRLLARCSALLRFKFSSADFAGSAGFEVASADGAGSAVAVAAPACFVRGQGMQAL